MIIRGNDRKVTQALAEESSRRIEETLNSYIYGQDQQTMASIVGSLLARQNKTLAVAESCTGGVISHLITSVAGSSKYYLGGVTTYANSMKHTYLGVRNDLLDRVGAVSHEVAEAMALGIREKSEADISISITGIAGPGGGSAEKPVGTVFIGLSHGEVTVVHHCNFSGTRYEIQHLTAQTALNLVRNYLLI
jgi:nicotinamide-nucleotide amidase